MPSVNKDTLPNIFNRIKLFGKLSNTHYLVHIHQNNVGYFHIIDNIIIPYIFECTYIRKDVQEFVGYNNKPFPHSMDRPSINNNKYNVNIDWYPFCIFNYL